MDDSDERPWWLSRSGDADGPGETSDAADHESNAQNGSAGSSPRINPRMGLDVHARNARLACRAVVGIIRSRRARGSAMIRRTIPTA